MKFYYVDENNKPIQLTGTNKEIYEAALSKAKAAKSNLGVLGVIDKKRLKATLVFNCYKKNVYTQVNYFVRKYAAIEALQELIDG